MVWLITALLLLGIAWFFTLMNRRAARENQRVDTGAAILDFARAFPDHPIRSLHVTRDGAAIFARLHDGRIGFMQSHGAHYACYVLELEQVRAQCDGRSLKVRFPGTVIPETSFIFRTHKEADDIMNWLKPNAPPTAVNNSVPAENGQVT